MPDSNYLQNRPKDSNEETASDKVQVSSQYLKQHEKPTSPLNRNLRDPPEEQVDKEITKTAIFLRMWFGLNKKEIGNICIGSFAAAFAGISKPIFGYFIITIGVTYYQSNAKRTVGWYSIFFSSIGFLSLFAHTVQHYLFGVVGEKAMTNLRRALFSGITTMMICKSH